MKAKKQSHFQKRTLGAAAPPGSDEPLRRLVHQVAVEVEPLPVTVPWQKLVVGFLTLFNGRADGMVFPIRGGSLVYTGSGPEAPARDSGFLMSAPVTRPRAYGGVSVATTRSCAKCMEMRVPMRRFLFLLVFFAGCAALMAQTGSGRIQGTVTDGSGALVPGAAVALEQAATGNIFRTQSNSTGFFIFPAVQPGRYRLTAEASGFEKWSGELQLQTGQETVIDPSLAVGATATQITIAGDVSSLVTTTSANLGYVAERERIEQLPLNGRFLQSLIMMTTPGLENGYNGALAPRVYGLPDGAMGFLQDGVSLNDANLQTMTTRPPGLDTVQEYRVETSVASARYSRPASTILSTRSGTNQWHGGLFYTGRNNGFGVARRRQDYYEKPPQLIRNEFGASLGGPVLLPKIYNGRNRTFFFVAWEGLRLRSQNTISASLPTLAMRQGDFSQLRDAQGRLYTLYDPWSTAGAAQNWARTPFSGNLIPSGRRSPLAAYVYGVMVAPTNPERNPLVSANWFGPNPVKQNDATYTVRIDHRLGDRDLVYGRYSRGETQLWQRRSYNTNNTPVSLDFTWGYESRPETMHTAMLSWSHTFTPQFFVETVATGANMYFRYCTDDASARQNFAQKLGTPNPFNVPSAPRLSNTGFSLLLDGAMPRWEDTRPISAEQNYTMVRGQQQLQFGWRYRRETLDVLPDRPPQATIGFNSSATALYDPATGTAMGAVTRTGYDAANFYLGVAASYSQVLPAGIWNMRSTEFSSYAQDDWKVGRGLTLNIGVRYEYLPPMLDTNGTNSVFDLNSKSLVRAASLADLIRSGNTTQQVADNFARIGVKYATAQGLGYPGGLVNVNRHNFSPRLGFAKQWKFGNRSAVLRGGFGVYRFPLPARTYQDQRNNPPLQGSFSYNINSAAQTPDGRANWGLRSVPLIIAGQNSAHAIDPNSPSAVARGLTVYGFHPSLPTSLAREWNLTLETELLRNTLLRVAAVGTQGRNLEQEQIVNAAPGAYVWYVTTGLPLPTGEFASVARRSFDQVTYGDIDVYRKSGFSNFAGLQVDIQRRFSRGLAIQWMYVMSNALSTNAGGAGGGGALTTPSTVPDTASFLPGAVPADYDERNRFYNYQRDTGIPKHRMRWNFVVDLPFGRGRKLLPHSGRLLDGLVGGWQLAADSAINSRYWGLPAGAWGRKSDLEIYGNRYPVQDCRSGACIPGYLYYNGYIPANRINSHDAQGRPNGVMGVPSNYRPSHQPIYPTPANGGSPSDPNYALYETNNVIVPLKNGTQQRVAFDNGLNPWRSQSVPGPWLWVMNSSLFKVIPLGERLRLRLNMDFFNVLNMPGTGLPNATTGIISMQNSTNAPRQLQWTVRLNW